MSNLLSSFRGRRFTRLDSETVEMYHVDHCEVCNFEVKVDPIITREANDDTLIKSGLTLRALAPVPGSRPWCGAPALCSTCKAFTT